MKDKNEFFAILNEIDGRDVSEYQRLEGDFDFSRFVVKTHHLQTDVMDEPTLVVLRVPQSVAGFPAHLFNSPVRRTALEDLLTREVAHRLEALAHYDEEGVSRRSVSIATPGQKILPRSSLAVSEDFVEARVYVQLPARGGCVAGDRAKRIFFDDLPEVVSGSLVFCNLDEEGVEEFVSLMEDADQVRQVLPTRGWVSFIGEGSMLPRRPGTDLPDEARLESLRLSHELVSEVEVPNRKTVRGLGIPAGVTLVLGDTYAGRGELMSAIADGIYNHVPGDGRELVITVPDAIYVAAEPGRSVQRVNISPFVRKTVDGSDPEEYSSEHADAQTSQAAAVVEALEVGANLLLFDEADSAPAFFADDSRLASLVRSGAPSVTPLAAHVRQLADELGVSVVIGASSLAAEFVPMADTVLRVHDYAVEDVTQEAKALAVRRVEGAGSGVDLASLVERSRWVVPSSLDPSAGRRDVVVEALDLHLLQFGRSLIDLAAVSQLAELHQTATIGLILAYARTRYMNEPRPVREILDLIDRDLSTDGLECLSRELRGDLTRPRRYEIAAALNRLDTLRVTRPTEP